ncbi:MAG TPA: tetratricopeptide repeat protein, partial [Vicinamibacterales bacterium]|nr:tetratricopeptide repeat protein [Vicinamibacterales bacterium]
MTKRWSVTATALTLTMAACVAAAAPAADSARMARAKDLVADEQWRRAVAELRAAYGDPSEPARDEAAFWLAHSLYQSGDAAAALQTIEQLERKFPRSRWVFPARSLKLEIAHRLNRSDMLWHFAVPPAPPVAPTPPHAPAPLPAQAAPPLPPAPPAVAPATPAA